MSLHCNTLQVHVHKMPKYLSLFLFLLNEIKSINFWNSYVLFYAGDSEDELDDEEPHLETVMVQHPAAVNRIRVS